MNAVEIHRVSKDYHVGFAYRRVLGVRDLELEVREGEIFGFIGANGAGKTTTIKLIIGLILPDKGEGKVLGRPLGDPESRRGLGYLPEQPYYTLSLTGIEYLRDLGRLSGLRGRALARRAELLADELGIAQMLARPLEQYSKGQLQRFGLVQALLAEPRLLILDEPMSGIDPIGQNEIRNRILSFSREGGTVFFSSHIVADIEVLADRVGLMSQGRLSRVGHPAELFPPESNRLRVRLAGAAGKDLAALSAPDCEAHREGDDLVLLVAPHLLPMLACWAAKEGLAVKEIEKLRPRLAEIFASGAPGTWEESPPEGEKP